MRKRRTRVLIWSVVAAVSVLAGLTFLGEELAEIYGYTATTLCDKPVPPAEPGGKVTYVACSDLPAEMPTIN